VKEEPARGTATDSIRVKEAERLASRIAGATIVACDERGTTMTSVKFATFLQDARERARDLAFVIGGAYGLSDALRDGAQARLALAPWTLPHELARLVLAEQLYRAGTIVRGEPYHK
jgi:23S rRNA (pseudouridine1915-N3)-methyltransferase